MTVRGPRSWAEMPRDRICGAAKGPGGQIDAGTAAQDLQELAYEKPQNADRFGGQTLKLITVPI